VGANFAVKCDQGGEFSPCPPGIPRIATVLVVDDEALIRWSVAESLSAAGFGVLEAGSAREALERLDNGGGAIGVTLLDLKLPDSRDLGLLRRILLVAPACRVILMTAQATPEILEEALRAGAFRALAKPFDMNRIAGLVREAVAA
jgi:DNA-binding NtrC family response regulator